MGVGNEEGTVMSNETGEGKDAFGLHFEAGQLLFDFWPPDVAEAPGGRGCFAAGGRRGSMKSSSLVRLVGWVALAAHLALLSTGCCRYGSVVEQMRANEHAAMEAAQGAGNE